MSATTQDTHGHVENTHRCADDFDAAITSIIKRIYGGMRGAAKRLAADADTSTRTAEGWLNGRSCPRGVNLVNLLVECETLDAEIRSFICELRAKRKNERNGASK